MGTSNYRSIWISDVHLGMPDCKAESLLAFLEASESEYLYLLGDIIDLWNLKNGWYWPQIHNAVIQKLLLKAKQGCRVVYIPGNHDDALRKFAGKPFGSISIALRTVHETADGRRLLVLHGDEFDAQVKHNALIACLGDSGYDLLQWFDRRFNQLLGKLGYPYWSLSAFIKTRVKNAVLYIERFEAAAAREASHRGVDGLVCGHIHKPNVKPLDGVLYCNDGDWVENCTALVEFDDGKLHLLKWSEERAMSTLLA